MRRHSFILLFSALLAFGANGQSAFKDSLILSNPVRPGADYTLEEKVKAHRDFLEAARVRAQPLRQLYACIYLFSDYMLAADYAEAARHLLEAEQLANASGQPGWAGEVISRKAIISIRVGKTAEAVQQFEEAARLFGVACDTLRMAECLEQLGASYSQAGDFAAAQKQYEIVLPLLVRYGNERQMRVALGNFGNVFLGQNRPAEAITYLERALAINRKLGDREKEAQDLGDLANAYAKLKNYDQAFIHYRQSLQIAQDFNLAEVRCVTYSDLANTYATKGDFANAYGFLKKYHTLYDSIAGAETQAKIASLEIQYESREKELALKASRDELAIARQNLRYRAIFAGLILLCLALAVTVALKFRQNHRQNMKTHAVEQKIMQQDLKLKELEHGRLLGRLQTNQQDLTDLALDIARKNTFVEGLIKRLEVIEPAFAKSHGSELLALQQFILNHHRLNREKAVFQEKTGVVNHEFFEKLSARFGELSPSEKDLCGLIRLNLSNKEIAMLRSISPNSAKIARYRLRKRLHLNEKEDIVSFLQNL